MKKGLLMFSIIALTAFGLKKYSASLFSIQKYHCIQTGCLSDDYFASIKTHVHTLLDKNYSAHQLIAYLKKEFPVLTQIIVAYRPCSTYVMMHAHKPLCCINDTVVLAADHELYPKDLFAVHVCDVLAHMTVAQEYMSKVPSLVPLLLNELPVQCNEIYNLELLHEHYVRLTDKQNQNFTIITSVGQKKMSSLLAHCASVKKVMRERKDFDTSQWITDIRFADYIVAYRA